MTPFYEHFLTRQEFQASTRMAATPPDTPVDSPKGPSSPTSFPKAVEGEEPVAKKARGEEETSYKTFDEWIRKEGFDAVYKNIEERFDKGFGVKEFARLHNKKESKIASWEEFDEKAREKSDHHQDKLLNVIHPMVILIRDQNDFIEKLREKIRELEESQRKVAD